MNKKNQPGVVLLFIVLILGGVSLGALLALSRVSIGNISIGLDRQNAWVVREDVRGCLHEVLIWLQADSGYTTTSVTTNGVTCNVAITTPGAGLRDVLVTKTDTSIHYGMRANINVDPVSINTVDESLN